MQSAVIVAMLSDRLAGDRRCSSRLAAAYVMHSSDIFGRKIASAVIVPEFCMHSNQQPAIRSIRANSGSAARMHRLYLALSQAFPNGIAIKGIATGQLTRSWMTHPDVAR